MREEGWERSFRDRPFSVSLAGPPSNRRFGYDPSTSRRTNFAVRVHVGGGVGGKQSVRASRSICRRPSTRASPSRRTRTGAARFHSLELPFHLKAPPPPPATPSATGARPASPAGSSANSRYRGGPRRSNRRRRVLDRRRRHSSALRRHSCARADRETASSDRSSPRVRRPPQIFALRCTQRRLRCPAIDALAARRRPEARCPATSADSRPFCGCCPPCPLVCSVLADCGADRPTDNAPTEAPILR